MEENKIEIFNESALIEGETEPFYKEKIKKIGTYIMVTISFFVLTVACIFSEIGYGLINNSKEMLLVRFGVEDGVKDSPVGHIVKNFFGVEKIHELKKAEGTFNDTDEPLNKNDEDSMYLPVEADTEVNDESHQKTPDEEDSSAKYPVISLDLSQKQLGENYIVNETGYTPDIEKLKNFSEQNDSLRIDDKSQPTVLIIHTHATESYLEDGKDFYTEDEGEISRTNDKSKNMVRIGKIIADALNAGGIKTLHCEILHDEESYQDSYTRAAESIKAYLAKYPSIKYVFDVHRDAILKSDGSLVKATTKIEGESIAQVMTVVGSDYKGANFPNWESNLSAALKLKRILDADAPSVSRPIYLRGAAYNQQYAPCSILLEIGSSGNTLKEAERAAEIVAKAIVKLIDELSTEH